MKIDRVTCIGIGIYACAMVVLACCTYYQIFVYEPPVHELPYYMGTNFTLPFNSTK